MSNSKHIPIIIEIPKSEAAVFDKKIKEYRVKYIRKSDAIVESVLAKNLSLLEDIKSQRVSQVIFTLRELVWKEYLEDEVSFNVVLMQELYGMLDTPKYIMDAILQKDFTLLEEDDLKREIINLCGEYAGRIFPYIYRLSLSNTQSRRSRAGKTFEAIIYKVYECLGYEFDSQGKVGRKIFSEHGLGKKVDSILPSIKAYEEKRSKTIVGTMKTTLRERWQEVAEEIERTKIPEIHLLTADNTISKSKAKEMSNHNITVVAYEWVANSEMLKSMKNIISFEEYLFEEIPVILKYWE